MPTPKIKVAIVDDHKLFRDGIVSLLKNFDEMLVSFEASNGVEFFKELSKRKRAVDVILLDIDMPEMDGIAVLKKLRGTMPSIKPLVITRHNEDELIYELLELGAKGFLQKSADIEEVVDAIHSVFANEAYFNSDISVRVVKKLAKKESKKRLVVSEGLTQGEKEIIKLLCDEFSTREIAEKFFVSERTIETHRANIFKKTRARNLAGIVMYAFRHGIVD